MLRLSILLLLAVANLASESVTGRAFAVFAVHYSDNTKDVLGGVIGTAFFRTARKAQTAYHVLKPSSFTPQPGYTRVRIWLVFEKRAAIEVKPEHVAYNPALDTTEIDFALEQVPALLTVSDSRDTDSLWNPPSRAIYETEGFPANSAGPQVAWRGEHIEVVAVPKLERIRLSGKLIQSKSVTLRANDVNLEHVPCFQLSYQPIEGMSGGPVMVNGKLVAMNSFADPATRRQTWAVTRL